MDGFTRMFGGQLQKKASCPIEKDDSPELDTSPLLDQQDTKRHMSLIGALQWCVTLGRFDIAAAVMVMSRFRVEPREGHLERVKRIYGYLRKHPDAAIRFRTGIPTNEEHFHMPQHSWMARFKRIFQMMLPFQRETLSVQPLLSMPIFSTAKSQASLLVVYCTCLLYTSDAADE